MKKKRKIYMKNFAVINKSCTFVLNKKHKQFKTKHHETRIIIFIKKRNH